MEIAKRLLIGKIAITGLNACKMAFRGLSTNQQSHTPWDEGLHFVDKFHFAYSIEKETRLLLWLLGSCVDHQTTHFTLSLLTPLELIMKSSIAIASLVLLSLVDASLVRAGFITYEFSGVFSQTTGTSIPLNTPFAGRFTFDSSQSNPGDPNFQVYSYSNFEFTVLGVKNQFSGGYFEVDNDGTFVGDRISIDFGGGVVGSDTFTHGRLRFTDFTNNALSSANLPLNTNISDWSAVRLTMYTPAADLVGQVQSFNAVPEPTASSLLSIGMLSLVLRRKPRPEKLQSRLAG